MEGSDVESQPVSLETFPRSFPPPPPSLRLLSLFGEVGCCFLEEDLTEVDLLLLRDLDRCWGSVASGFAPDMAGG